MAYFQMPVQFFSLKSHFQLWVFRQTSVLFSQFLLILLTKDVLKFQLELENRGLIQVFISI